MPFEGFNNTGPYHSFFLLAIIDFSALCLFIYKLTYKRQQMCYEAHIQLFRFYAPIFFCYPFVDGMCWNLLLSEIEALF